MTAPCYLSHFPVELFPLEVETQDQMFALFLELVQALAVGLIVVFQYLRQFVVLALFLSYSIQCA